MIICPKPLDTEALTGPLPAPGKKLDDTEAMSLAIKVAWRGLGHVSPNPMVGAVAVDAEGEFLGAAAHMRVGDAHAEANLVQDLKTRGLLPRLKGGRIYVSLEPCSHHGKTPPCADMVAKLPISELIYLRTDPNPLVSGRGAQHIAAAGIKVREMPELASEANRQNSAFFWRQRFPDKVFVGLKSALSLGGAMALAGDRRQWLSDERSRTYGHFLRLFYDGVAVGAGTLAADNPALDPVRCQHGSRPPWKFVLDPWLRALKARPLAEHNILKTDPQRVGWIVNEEAAAQHAHLLGSLTALGATVCRIPFDHGQMSPQAMLDFVKGLGLSSLLLEGGAGLYGPFIDAHLVQRVHIFQTPWFLGGGVAIHLEGRRINRQRALLANPEITVLEQDWLIEGDISQ